MSKNELFDNLYSKTKKLCDMLNQPSLFVEPVKDSVIIANIGNEEDNKDKENINIKSYDAMDKAELIDYSLKPNGNFEYSKLKDSISNSLMESSENGSTAKKDGFLTSEGKMVRIDITKYKSLVLKFGKINLINNGYMNNAFVTKNDIIFLETKIPLFKAKNSNEMLYDTLQNFHQIGSDKEDTNYAININKRNSHKINIDENNISSFIDSKIYIFLHKSNPPTSSSNSNKKNNSKKDKDINENKNSDIIGYSSLELKKVFLSEDFKFTGKCNLVEKKKINSNKKNDKRSPGKRSSSNLKNKTKDNEKGKKDKAAINEALYDEKGERVIGSIEITCYLKRPYSNILEEDENRMQSSINKLIKQNNNINENNNNININVDNNKINQSPMKEFIIGQPPMYNNKGNESNNNFYNNNYNEENKNIKIEEKSQNGEDMLMADDDMEKIRTDINGDILVLYLRINELKSSNDIYNSENSIQNNINQQINNIDKNKNIIFYNYSGPQLPRHNFYLRHKIFPENKDANSEIIWGKVMPNFNYTIQMPFTLNQKTVELLDNGKFIVEVWTKGENNNTCLGFVSFDLKNVLDSLKVDENTITTLQLYKNILPYIIYDDYYQITQLNDTQDLGTIYLKVCMGIGTPGQVHNFDNLLKKAQNQSKNYQNFGEQINGMGNNNNGNMNMNINNNNNNINNNNNENEKNNLSLDPFKEDIKDINKEELNQNNISKAADINVEQIFEKNKKNLENNNMFNSKESSINQNLKKSESFEEHQPNKKKIMNPFLVPQNYEQENNDIKGSKKETAKFNKLINSEKNFNLEGSNRYNNNFNQDNFNKNNNYNNNTDYKSEREKKIFENYEINKKNEYTFDINNNYLKEKEKDINTNYQQNIPNINENDNYIPSMKNNNLDNDIYNNNNKNDNYNFNSLNNQDDFNQNIHDEKNNEEIIEENININNNNNNYVKKENEINQQPINNYEQNNNFNQEEENINEKDKNIDFNMNENNEIIDDKNKEKENDKNINIEINNNNDMNNNINLENISSHVKKHIFTISIQKIYNCQILSKLPPTYLRYQFFTDQKPLRSELFTFSQYSVDSSIIDVDMKSMHSIILPKVEKIKDYLNDFLVEFLYDNPHKKNNQIIIGRVNIPSDEFASLISEKDILTKNNMNEISRVLFIYGTEKIQRNKCIIGKLKLSFKYTNVDVSVSPLNNLFNGSLLNNSNNNFLINSLNNNNNNLGPNFAGSIYLEKETIFNRKIPKNAVLKIIVEKFNSTSLFEDYFRKQFSIHFVFSIFGEVPKMENQYGKRSTSKKHNLLNCDFGETLSYKVEIDQDIIDYLKCRNGMVYLVYKISKEKKGIKGLDNDDNLDEKYNSENEDLNVIDFENISKNKKIIGKGFFNLNEILTSADKIHCS